MEGDGSLGIGMEKENLQLRAVNKGTLMKDLFLFSLIFLGTQEQSYLECLFSPTFQ